MSAATRWNSTGKEVDMYPVDELIADFGGCLEYYSQTTRLNSYYRGYLAAIRLRKELGSVAAALKSEEFMKAMHKAMEGFFGFGRWKTLLPLDEFKTELRRHSHLIESFDGEQLGTETNEVSDKLWKLIDQLRLTTEKSRLVSGSKALHLLLPELVVPIDRQYTGAFLYRYSDEFDQKKEQDTFHIAFASFRRFANAASPESYVGTQEVHATRTKVIDNAIIAFVERGRGKLKAAAAEMQTRELAYKLYEKRERVDGDDLKDWFDAEAILRKRAKPSRRSSKPRKHLAGDPASLKRSPTQPH
jgi:hypothetical protein